MHKEETFAGDCEKTAGAVKKKERGQPSLPGPFSLKLEKPWERRWGEAELVRGANLHSLFFLQCAIFLFELPPPPPHPQLTECLEEDSCLQYAYGLRGVQISQANFPALYMIHLHILEL